jgi:sortase A
VAKTQLIKDLSIEELRQLIIEKKMAQRKSRIESFQKSGRIIPVTHPMNNAPHFSSTEINPPLQPAYGKKSRAGKRGILDQFLFLVEILAVVGFLLILFNGYSVIRNLNREISAVLQQPTMTPTPLIHAVILPSGHTPPGSPGGVLPNDSEIPAHLAPMVQSLANLPIPTPGPKQGIRIQIPTIDVDAPIVQGDGWEQLKKGVGQALGTPHPGENGNIVLSAHNDIFGEIFRDLDKLKTGDRIVLYTSQRPFTYIVRETSIVEPTQVEVMAPSEDSEITLVSCYPYLVDNKRIVVKAELTQ